MAQSKVKPWLPDDRSNDERHADFVTQDINSVEQRLMAAWDDVPYAVGWHLGIIVPKLTGDADREKDALAAGWIRDIENRIRALPNHQSTPQGALTREQLLNAADGRVSAAHNDKQKVAEECEALRQESQRRTAVPFLKLVNEFKLEISQLALSDTVKAGYLSSVVSDLEKLVGPEISNEVVTKNHVTSVPEKKTRDSELRAVIVRASNKAADKSSWLSAWAEMLVMANKSDRPAPIIGGANGEIVYGDPETDEPAKILTKEQFRKRYGRLLASK